MANSKSKQKRGKMVRRIKWHAKTKRVKAAIKERKAKKGAG